MPVAEKKVKKKSHSEGAVEIIDLIRRTKEDAPACIWQIGAHVGAPIVTQQEFDICRLAS